MFARGRGSKVGLCGGQIERASGRAVGGGCMYNTAQ